MGIHDASSQKYLLVPVLHGQKISLTNTHFVSANIKLRIIPDWLHSYCTCAVKYGHLKGNCLEFGQISFALCTYLKYHILKTVAQKPKTMFAPWLHYIMHTLLVY